MFSTDFLDYGQVSFLLKAPGIQLCTLSPCGPDLNLRMNKIHFNYSLKNIGLPNHNQYQKRLIDKVESVIQRMRWKTYYFLNDKPKTEENDTFGLPSKKCAPPVIEMKSSEDVIQLVSNVKFRKITDPFLNNIAEDLEKVNSPQNVLIFSDETRNVYEAAPETYNKLLTDYITKTYKLGNDVICEDINSELKKITNVSTSDRVDTVAKRSAFIALKDHKKILDSNPKCRLINPSKSELRKVSKVILDDINSKIRSTLNLNQWKNTQFVSTYQLVPAH